MSGSNFKKFNSVLILFLIYISLKNISKFTEDDIGMPTQDYSYKFSQDDSSTWNTRDQALLNIDLEEYKNLETSDLESEIKQSLKKRFKLKKKSEFSDDTQDIANYIDTEVASDYVYNQNDVNLSLVPVEETILFSGIPEPKVKPIPLRPEYSKSVIISIKNKKMLSKNLENYIDSDQFNFVYESLENNLNYNLEENLTFLMNEDDYVLEIQTFSKNFKNLNSRRDINKNFIFYYEETPTERKVTRNRLIVKDSVSRTLKSAEIPV